MLVVAEAVVNLVMSALLVGPLGVIGVALGTAVPLAFFQGVLHPMLLQKELELSPASYWRMHAPTLGIGALYLVLIGGLAIVPLQSYARFAALCAGTVVVFAILTVTFVPAARAELKKRLAGLRRRLASAG